MKLLKIFSIACACVLIPGLTFNAEAAKKRTPAKKSHSAASSQAVTVTKGETHTYGNGALIMQDFACKRGKISLNVEYPIGGNPQLVTAVRNFIKNSLDDKFTGSLDTPDALMKKTISALKKEFVEAEQQIKVTYSNDKLVTVNNTGYFYGGGAHGMPLNDSASFLYSDAKALTAEMLPSINVMRPYILQGMASKMDMSLAEIDDMCFGNSAEIPMGKPFVMGDGLHVIYQAYDIAPYSAGMPEAVIPFSKLKGVVSSQVEKFF